VTVADVSALPSAEELVVERIGEATLPSPMRRKAIKFIDESRRILVCSETTELAAYTAAGQIPPSFEWAGARESIFFDPSELACGIVTCGGLCPGLNDVIRSITLTLIHMYGVRKIYGFRYGYAGLAKTPLAPPMLLDTAAVRDIHHAGGSVLGSSRGPQDLGEMIDTMHGLGVGILFTIGGDGTLRGAARLAEEIERRGLPIAVIGVPKTIDNDLVWVERSFGFATAVEEARQAIAAAHAEAEGAWNGVGLIKLMGRYSGFIAAQACLSNSDANFCLVPEVPFELEGPDGFLAALEARLAERRHAVVVVAEGAGQDLVPTAGQRDKSGNLKLGDIGPYMRDRIKEYFSAKGTEIAVKYIDPSYMIRGGPANALDSEFCLKLGQRAVHAGMAGRTKMVVGYWNQHFVHVPLEVVTARRRLIEPDSSLWHSVLQATGQPQMISGSRAI
jgi:6-phosphofructokinase 1